ncbi:hypothetical protein N7494_013240 [Penicillium frequentans]|uniref:Uncharacterized protein n=1 Tax=Penicillium frequentans TaxID=3151616 RepID=A0AAD6G9J1_9EURO|nr:hypothetical protein N7494_013240 [Penicillium glabrum]
MEPVWIIIAFGYLLLYALAVAQIQDLSGFIAQSTVGISSLRPASTYMYMLRKLGVAQRRIEHQDVFLIVLRPKA